jgi:hypothetical protein
MRKIRVTRGGCGVTIANANGTVIHTLKTPKDKPFECDDALAARFVEQGVAVYCDNKEIATEANVAGQIGKQDEEEEATTQETEKPSAHFVAEDLETWDYNDLKKLAADMGVTPAGKKKADYIAAIVAVDIEIDDEDEDLPDLGVADPE